MYKCCFFGVFLHESASTVAKSRTNLSISSGKATKLADWHQIWHTCANPYGNGYTPNKLPVETQGGTWGVLGGQQFKIMGKLSDWHQLWFTSADSPGNGHRLNTSRPQVAFWGGGLRCHIFKSLGKLSNGWTDWPQIWQTSADPSGNGYTPNKLPLETQGGTWGGGGLGVKHSKVLGSCQTAGPIGTNFGSRLWIHLGMDTG